MHLQLQRYSVALSKAAPDVPFKMLFCEVSRSSSKFSVSMHPGWNGKAEAPHGFSHRFYRFWQPSHRRSGQSQTREKTLSISHLVKPPLNQDSIFAPLVNRYTPNCGGLGAIESSQDLWCAKWKADIPLGTRLFLNFAWVS
jgi:hypothetical protein